MEDSCETHKRILTRIAFLHYVFSLRKKRNPGFRKNDLLYYVIFIFLELVALDLGNGEVAALCSLTIEAWLLHW